MAQFYTNNAPWDGKLKIATVSLTSSNIDEIVKVWKNCSDLFLFISEHIPPL